MNHYQLNLCFEAEVILPKWKTSIFRGGFGNNLKRLVCINRANESKCENCFIQTNCPYYKIFEQITINDEDQITRRIPHPYIFRCRDTRTHLIAGDSINLELILFGFANQYLPYIIQSIIEFGKRFGKKQNTAPFSIKDIVFNHTKSIWNENNTLNPIYLKNWFKLSDKIESVLAQTPLIINLLTPAHLIAHGKAVDAEKLDADILIKSIFRSVSEYNYFLNIEPLPDIDSIGDIKLIHKHVRWQNIERYSHRQQKTHTLGGLIGTIQLSNPNNLNFFKVLKIAEYCGIGKNRVFGNGMLTLNQEERSHN